MKSNTTYRHKSCLDVDMEVLKICYVNAFRFEAKVRLFNRHNGLFYENLRVNIMRDQLPLWEKVG